jgi:hypothetical protein
LDVPLGFLLPLAEVISLLVIDGTALTTGIPVKVISGKEGTRERGSVEELERDTEI